MTIGFVNSWLDSKKVRAHPARGLEEPSKGSGRASFLGAGQSPSWPVWFAGSSLRAYIYKKKKYKKNILKAAGCCHVYRRKKFSKTPSLSDSARKSAELSLFFWPSFYSAQVKPKKRFNHFTRVEPEPEPTQLDSFTSLG